MSKAFRIALTQFKKFKNPDCSILQFFPESFDFVLIKAITVIAGAVSHARACLAR